MDLKELILRIKGDSSGAEAALNRVQGATSKLGGIVKTIIAGAAVAAVVKFGESCINAAAESQSAEALLRNSLGNIKGMTDKAKDSAVDWVNSMEKSKSFDDADISAALQRIVVKTGDLKTAQEYVSVAMEVSRNKGIDLASATAMLDTAYNGSARGLKAFGLVVQDGATGLDYLRQIQEKVAGSGEAWSKTLAGQRAAFKTTFDNFKEAVGGTLMPLASKFMESIMPFLIQSMEWIQKHMPQIQEVMSAVCAGIGGAFKIAGEIINGVIVSIKWIIEHAKEAIAWAQGVLANKGVDQGGVYVAPHSAGGWVGLNGPEVALVGEKGPEYITPNGQLGSNDLLLRGIADRLDTLIRVSAGIPSGVGNALNGLGR